VEEWVPWERRGKFGAGNELQSLDETGQRQGRWFGTNADELHHRANGTKVIGYRGGMMLRWDRRGNHLFRLWLDHQSQHT
jgi:hypothetical protein